MFRDVWSMDWDDLTSLVIALAAFITVFRVRRSSTRKKELTEIVDADVLGKFLELTDRITALELKLEAATIDLTEARAEIKELQKLEVYLEGKVREKEQHIEQLKTQLQTARTRIQHLEDICKRAGINGDDDEPI